MWPSIAANPDVFRSANLPVGTIDSFAPGCLLISSPEKRDADRRHVDSTQMDVCQPPHIKRCLSSQDRMERER